MGIYAYVQWYAYDEMDNDQMLNPWPMTWHDSDAELDMVAWSMAGDIIEYEDW